MRAKGLEGRKRLVSLGNRRKPSAVLGSDELGVGGGGNDIGSAKKFVRVFPWEKTQMNPIEGITWES